MLVIVMMMKLLMMLMVVMLMMMALVVDRDTHARASCQFSLSMYSSSIFTPLLLVRLVRVLVIVVSSNGS